jgi:hypothetical protein
MGDCNVANPLDQPWNGPFANHPLRMIRRTPAGWIIPVSTDASFRMRGRSANVAFCLRS